jgi:trehalose synthase-fused probable maltokinase
MGGWQNIFQEPAKTDLEAILPDYITPRRWFGSKARTIQTVEIIEAIAITPAAFLTLLRITYTEGEPETYQLPLAFSGDEAATTLKRERSQAVVTKLHSDNEDGILYDAVWDDGFCGALLETIAWQQTREGVGGKLSASTTQRFPQLRGPAEEDLSPALLGAEQSNTSIRYGNRLILKLFRRLETGTNPDLEIGHFLTEATDFAHIPGVAGALEYHPTGAPEAVTLAILQGFVPNQGDAWRYTLESLANYFEQVVSQSEEGADSSHANQNRPPTTNQSEGYSSRSVRL